MSNLTASICSFVLADSSSAPKADKLPSLSIPQAIVDFVIKLTGLLVTNIKAIALG